LHDPELTGIGNGNALARRGMHPLTDLVAGSNEEFVGFPPGPKGPQPALADLVDVVGNPRGL
jgi:hypothetical protein